MNLIKGTRENMSNRERTDKRTGQADTDKRTDRHRNDRQKDRQPNIGGNKERDRHIKRKRQRQSKRQRLGHTLLHRKALVTFIICGLI